MNKLTCPHCGTSALDTMRLCPQCRRPLAATPSASPAVVTAPLPAPASTPRGPFVPTGAWSGPSPSPAGMWRRSAALLLDLVLLALAAALAMGVLPALGGLISSWLYFAVFESTGWQGTPGKRMLKIKVVDANGVPLRFGRASLRFACRFLSALPFGLGYAMALFNPDRQTLHDLLASTRVVAR